jgi:hypothetical protein
MQMFSKGSFCTTVIITLRPPIETALRPESACSAVAAIYSPQRALQRVSRSFRASEPRPHRGSVTSRSNFELHKIRSINAAKYMWQDNILSGLKYVECSPMPLLLAGERGPAALFSKKLGGRGVVISHHLFATQKTQNTLGVTVQLLRPVATSWAASDFVSHHRTSIVLSAC